MQEVVDSLTAQKLQLTTNVCDMERTVATATAAETNHKSELQRMVQENADLVISVKRLELQLEKSINNAPDSTADELLQKIQIENQNLLAANGQLTASNERLQLKRKTIADAHNLLSAKSQGQETKLRLYKTKLIDFSAQLKELRACKEVLLQTVREYSQAVSKWQSEILTVSNEFFDKNRLLRLENKQLKERIQDLDKIAADLVAARDNDLDEQRQRYEQLLEAYRRLEEEKLKFAAMLETMKSTAEADGDGSLDVKSLKELLNESEQKCASLQVSLDAASKRANDDAEQLRTLQQDFDELNRKVSRIDELTEINETSQSEISNLKCQHQNESAQFQTKIQLLENEMGEFVQEIAMLKSMSTKASDELKEQIAELMREKESLGQSEAANTKQIVDLKSLLDNSETLQMKLQDDLSDKMALITNLQNVAAETVKHRDEQLKQKSIETSELLTEMSEINEALKKRGDIISQQEQRLTELAARHDATLTRANELDALAANRTADIERLNDRIKELERMPAAAAVAVVAPSLEADQMSTSTVSRAEDMARMRELDESFEDKYNRLRTVALKLKRKVAEQTKVIAELETKTQANCTEEVQISSKLGAIEVQVRNLQMLQSENDRLQDELDVARVNANKMIELQERLDAMQTNDTSDADRVHSGKLDAACKEYVKQIAALKEEINAAKLCKRGVDEELAKLRQECKVMAAKGKEQKDEEAKVRAELAKVRASVKSTNVLNLEMEAYEKSLNEMSTKMDAKKLKITEVNILILIRVFLIKKNYFYFAARGNYSV